MDFNALKRRLNDPAVTDQTAYLLIACFVIFLLVFGWKVHVIEVIGTAETDGYADAAELLRSGTLPRDPFRPLLYPILAAGAGSLLGNSFAGARTVSTLAAGLALLFVYLLGRSYFDRRVGILSVSILMLNINVMTTGMSTATDMTFAAFSLMSIYFLARFGTERKLHLLVISAAGLALAGFTRYAAVFFVPAVAITLFRFSRAEGKKKLFFFMFVYAAVFVLILMPHFLLTAKIFGSPFYSENWKNLAFKLYGNWDWSYFRRVPYDGPLALLRDSPREIFFSFFRELLRFFTSTLYHFGVQGLSGTLFAASFLGGLARLAVGADRKSADVVVFLLSYVLCGCLFYYSGVRFMFPALLLACIVGINFIQRSGTRARVGAAGRAVVMVVYFTTMVYSVIVHVPKYINAHPVAELAAARGLEREFGRDIKVAGTFRFMQRYVGYDYELLDDAYNAERDDENLFFDRMKSSLERNQITYVIVGPLNLGNRPRSLLECGKAPSFLSCIHEKDGVVVYRVNR